MNIPGFCDYEIWSAIGLETHVAMAFRGMIYVLQIFFCVWLAFAVVSLVVEWRIRRRPGAGSKGSIISDTIAFVCDYLRLD